MILLADRTTVLAGLCAAILAVSPAPAQEPGRAGHPDWDARDAEARWELIARDVERDPDAAEAWVPFLAAEGEHELLEWIVLTSPNGWTEAREALVAADAPQWIRVSVWRAGAGDSHVRGAVRSDLERAGGAFQGWLALHPEARTGAAAAIADDLAGAAEPDLDAARRYLPPLDEALLYAPLFHEGPVADLGERVTAAPDEVLARAIERAIETLAAQLERPRDARERVAALVGHSHERVARSAALAITRFPERDVPIEALLRTARDERESPTRREAALMAASYGWPARASVELHCVATQPAHPLWRVAVSRLGDLGDAFTLEQLSGLPRATLRPADAALLDDSLTRIRARGDGSEPPTAKQTRALLERAALADLTCAPIERRLVRWTLELMRSHGADPEVRATLRELATGYELDPAFDPRTRFGTVTERVRAYARELSGP